MNFIKKQRVTGLFLIVLIFLFSCKKGGQSYYSGIHFQKDKVYIFYRETKSKAGEIARSYNKSNCSYSHVAVGGFLNGKMTLFHILYDEKKQKNKKTELIVQDIDDFYNPEDEDVKSGAILQVNEITAKDFAHFKNIVTKLSAQKLKFDTHFDLNNDNQYYCSELVTHVLESVNGKYTIKPSAKKITGLDAAILGKDTLVYYPVDQFLNDHRFTPLKRWQSIKN
ncbi:MAG: hypothetical protein MUW56_14440 [Chryseobacterium sp.]|uniref:hypothetical protein n=1 Tax=Chryseobacterium sp. TaxID=1871047 RepID=UPI0025C5E100|nr:hypothetical protein [Chryseobacterium sp.]MCJ7934785.1 hypothetical protein [Chryseobacterium sp.]